MVYDCPICGWNPIDIYDDPSKYYVKDGQIHIVNNYYILSIKGTYIINTDIIDKFKADNIELYPKAHNFRNINDTWSGVSGAEWDETHFCPKCNKEFTFRNSSI